MMEKKDLQKLIFRISILLKGINSIFELTLGLIIGFLSTTSIYHIAHVIFNNELARDPNDFIANTLINMAANISVSTKEFISIYLIIHGIINFGLFYTIWNKKLTFYPIAIAIMLLLIIYQIIRLFHRFSVILCIVTIIDVTILYFVIKEFEGFKER